MIEWPRFYTGTLKEGPITREERREGVERGGAWGGHKSLFWESACMQASLLRREVSASLCCVADLLKVSFV